MVHVPGPKLDRENNPGNARWCEDHRRLECTKKSKRNADDVCHGPPIRGMDACKHHTGMKRPLAKAKGLVTINVWSAEGEHPNGKAPDSGMVVLALLQQSWMRCAAYGELLRIQVMADGAGDAINAEGFNPEDHVEVGGLIGFRYGAAGKEGHIYAVSEEARALVKLESEERDRAVKYAETAHKMGISTRLTDLAEKWGDAVVGRIMLVIAGLGLTPEQETLVPNLIQAHLSEIEIG